MGHRGLIIILDEMEKWQELNWKAQTRAGNLLGGLIWSATAEEGKRDNRSRPQDLMHSARNGGYPFATDDRCHLGIAIAMTPRGEYGPESIWRGYGKLKEIDLPHLTPALLRAYAQILTPLYVKAYDLAEVNCVDIAEEALHQWIAIGDGSMRTAVQQVIAAFDTWREQIQP
jgi:hypothetical protein